MHQKISMEMRERIVKSFLDMAIMAKLMDGDPTSGYDFITFFHRKFGVLLSPGTVYSVIYSMERHGLVNGVPNDRKRVYQLTEKGKETMKSALNLITEIQFFIEVLLSGGHAELNRNEEFQPKVGAKNRR